MNPASKWSPELDSWLACRQYNSPPGDFVLEYTFRILLFPVQYIEQTSTDVGSLDLLIILVVVFVVLIFYVFISLTQCPLGVLNRFLLFQSDRGD